MTKTSKLELSAGLQAIVDAADYEFLMQWKWSAVKGGDGRPYARRGYSDHGTMRWISLQRQIMQPPPGRVVIFKNKNGLDCRRENLRIATYSQRQMGCRASKQRLYKGVRQTSAHSFPATIGNSSKQVYYLGTYGSAEEAAYIRDLAARELYGEFAYLNGVSPRPAHRKTRSEAALATQRGQRGRYGFKGILPHGKYWVVQLSSASGHPRYLGTFDTAIEAARAWNAAALERWGDRADLNEIPVDKS